MRGATGETARSHYVITDFNPRSPCGERLLSYQIAQRPYLFQPTLPVRGATCLTSSLPSSTTISTHAPRAGSDNTGPLFRQLLKKYFNPRSPCGERPLSKSKIPRKNYFNPRSPCGERLFQIKSLGSHFNFNPRSPCGERPCPGPPGLQVM